MAALAVFEMNTELYPESWNTWDSLAEDLKEKLVGLKAVNSAAKSYSGFAGTDEVKDHTATPLTFQMEQEQEVEHPVALTHPATGRRALFVNNAFTARFSGMSEDESLPLLTQLWEHAITPEFTCRFRWRPGTLAIWDNRCTMHYAEYDYAPDDHRRMHRTTAAGERPAA